MDDSNSREFDADVTADDLKALQEEMEVMGDTEQATAERLFKENLPMAALSIIQIARGSGTDRTRLDAAKYIVERNLGRLQDMNPQTKDDKLAAISQELADAHKAPATASTAEGG